MSVKKIIYLISEDWYFCSHRLGLAKEAIKRNFEVYLLSNIDEHKSFIESQGIEVIPLRFLKRSRINLFYEILSILEIFYILLKINPDILHSVALKPVIYGSLSSIFFRKIKNINAIAGLGFIFSSGSLKAKILKPLIIFLLKIISSRRNSKLIVQNTDDHFFVSNSLNLKSRNISLIESVGVDLEKFQIKNTVNSLPVVILASRMIWHKGIGEFFAAASLIKKKNIKAKFVLVGKPDLENPSSISKEQLLFWNDSGIIEWWGYRDDMVEVFNQASIVTLPSFYGEGIPKVLIEAMACSKPIVTTNMPGCRDLVVQESNGLLVKPKDHIDLADALEKLIFDPKLCARMGRKGREIAVRKFDQKKIINNTLRLYFD